MIVPGILLIAGSASATPDLPSSVPAYHVVIKIENTHSNATPVPYDEEVIVNTSLYSFYENQNLSNIWFSYANGTVVNSWMQSGNSSDSGTIYWLKIDQSLSPYGSLGDTVSVYMNFLPKGSTAMNGVTTGEAPQLTHPYARYDNGIHMFNFYDNFSGKTLNKNLWSTHGNPSNITVNDGLNFTFNSASTHTLSIESIAKFQPKSYVEAYGVMNKSYQTSSTSYFLGGVGFGLNEISGTSPVMTSGWAQNDTNGPGLSLWNGNGFTYNYSSSVNPASYQVYGVGYINSSYTTGVAGGVVQNHTTAPLNTPYGTGLNAVIGFQYRNVPVYNHFYWIFVRNSTGSGAINLQYQIGGQSHLVTISPSGLPAGASWSATVNGTTYMSSGGNLTLHLLNGTYHAHFSSSDGYMPYPATETFLVTGSLTLYTAFESLHNQTYLRAVSTLSEGLSVSQYGYEQNVTVSGAPYVILSIALDEKSNTLFTALPDKGEIAARNLTDNAVTHVHTGTGTPTLFYDRNSNLIYSTSSQTGNLTIINPGTMKIVKNVSLPWTEDGPSKIFAGSSPGQIYVVSLNLSAKYDPVNIEVLGTSGTLVSNATMGRLNNTVFFYFMGTAGYNGNIVISNQTGVWTFSPSTNSGVFSRAPRGFTPAGVVHYAGGSTFMIGDANYSNVQDMFFNLSTHSFSKGIVLGGDPMSGAYNAVTGMQYVQYINTSSNILGGMAAIDTHNGSIVTSPYPTMSMQTLLDTNNGNLYLDDNPSFVGPSYFVHVIGTSRVYSVVFSENGLPSGTAWGATINGVLENTTATSFTEYAINGSAYSFAPENSSLYYVTTAPGTYTVNGKNIVVSVDYNHWAYIKGYFNQSGVNLTINGVSMGSDLTGFNETVTAGTFHIVLSDMGYKTVYENFTLQPGQSYNISTTLHKPQAKAPAGISPVDIYAVVGVVVTAAVVAGGYTFMRRRRP